MTNTTMPAWAWDRIREAVLRNLQWIKAAFGYDFPKLTLRLKTMDLDELAELHLITDAFVSMLNFEVRRAEKIFNEKEDLARARKFKKKLDAMFKQGLG